MKYFIFSVCFILLISTNAAAFTVLIDPGHGGDDIGAKANLNIGGKKKIITEKDITLSISKLVYEILQEQKHNVYLTRSVDRKVSLSSRAELAEKINADIFVSIHLNACTNKYSKGFEIYYLDNHSDVAVKKVEQAENMSWTKEDLVVQQILIDLVIERTVTSSKKLSQMIHQNFTKNKSTLGVVDRGVKAGLFYVLALAKRPATLIEIGFMSNQEELKKMLDKNFQKEMAKSIAQGIIDYLNMPNKLIKE